MYRGLFATSVLLAFLCASVTDAHKACQLKANPGTGDKNLTRYHFDTNDRTCKQFIYKGKGGNGNNFPTLEVCRKKCIACFVTSRKTNRPLYYTISRTSTTTMSPVTKKPQVDDVCLKPRDSGLSSNCTERLKRFYYNKRTGKCRKFHYTGCDGNENNFKTLKECEAKCVPEKQQQATTQPGPAGPSRRPSPKPKTVCELPKDRGHCHEPGKEKKTSRYLYNKKYRRCHMFYFYGCGGNANNFKTFAECSMACETGAMKTTTGAVQQSVPTESTPGTMCELPPRTGHCLAYFVSYYYDAKEKTCKKFIYGGCGGNANRFYTARSCMKKCGGKGNGRSFTHNNDDEHDGADNDHIDDDDDDDDDGEDDEDYDTASDDEDQDEDSHSSNEDV
ncbi:actinia tenebrosa protease inhibitors-like [Ornithodoros turicata]|uniref:actinia tenebrosa protease inhibitors-like n=1 Tax=Ornithodoros turicata TaxID=34597 RepID=UPI003138E6E2